MKEFAILEEGMDAATFNFLRRSVGWEEHREDDIRQALENTRYIVVAKNRKNEIVGMARVIGDIGMYYYIQDVIVLPEYQGMGIGMAMMDRVMEYIMANERPGMFIGLMAAKGKEDFYKRYGFVERPTENYGAGMCKEVR